MKLRTWANTKQETEDEQSINSVKLLSLENQFKDYDRRLGKPVKKQDPLWKCVWEFTFPNFGWIWNSHSVSGVNCTRTENELTF